MSPTAEQVTPETGIGRVVIEIDRRIEKFGIQLIRDPGGAKRADIIACHVQKGNMPWIDVLHSHGLYFNDIPHEPYSNFHDEVNRRVIQSVREAYAVTVPSEWVSMPYKRDMRLNPTIIGHGIDLEEWGRGAGFNGGYILWNKNRAGDVCDPTPAYDLALRGQKVVSTYAPNGAEALSNLTITGTLPHEKMKDYIRNADIYLATTMETFGIGILEALASGIPVLGYKWGAITDIVTHEKNGYLVDPGDIDGLVKGIEYIRANRPTLSAAASMRAADYSWDNIVEKYANLYKAVYEQRTSEGHGTTVVIPNHNYKDYVGFAIQSVLNQEDAPDVEIIVVDDCSTDGSQDFLKDNFGNIPAIKLVLNSTNQGVAAARNMGIRMAKNPYIVCLDADDKIAPRFVSVLSRALKNDRSLGIAYSGLTIIRGNEHTLYSSWPGEFEWLRQAAVSNPPSNCIPSGCMFRKEMWERSGGIRQVYAPGEDAEFWVRGLSIGYHAKRITKDGLFGYRVHDGSASRTKKYKFIDTWNPYMRDKKFPFGAPIPEKMSPYVKSYALPLVSVIIPVGDSHLNYLRGAIDSVLGQTFRDWELIVILDTDRDITEYRRAYPFINWQKTPKTGSGAGTARNIGLEIARAPLVLFLDADDYIAPTALIEMHKAYIEAKGEKYIYTDWVSVFGNGRKEANKTREYSQIAFFQSGYHAVTALIDVNQARAIKFDEGMQGWEDWDFYLRMALAGYCGQRLPMPLIYYRLETGVRRDYAFKHKDELIQEFQKRYNKDWKDKTMSPCCGGGNAGKIMLNYRRILLGEKVEDEKVRSLIEMSDGNTLVRLEYVGENVGSLWFDVKSGRRYRGGKNQMHRYIDAHAADVEQLMASGKWRVVNESLLKTSEVITDEKVISLESTADPDSYPVAQVTQAPRKKKHGR